MKEMNQEAKDGLNDVVQKMLKDAQNKRKQADDLAVAAKNLEDLAKSLSKELETISVISEQQV